MDVSVRVTVKVCAGGKEVEGMLDKSAGSLEAGDAEENARRYAEQMVCAAFARLSDKLAEG